MARSRLEYPECSGLLFAFVVNAHFLQVEKSDEHYLECIAYRHCVQVLIVVSMKNIIYWDIPPCSLLKADRRFGAK
jgi:hypothetical protein